MAVYGGARPRLMGPHVRVRGGSGTHPTTVSGGRRAARPVERRARRRTIRAQRRIRPVGLVMAAIVATFVLGLVQLTQTLQAAAMEHELIVLREERLQLERDIRTQAGTIMRWGSEPQVVDWAQQRGLDRLGGTLRIPAP